MPFLFFVFFCFLFFVGLLQVWHQYSWWLNLNKYISARNTLRNTKYGQERLWHFLQKSQQDNTHAGLNTFNKNAFFQCDKEVISFDSNGALKLNTVYKQEFTLTNTSGKELEVEFYTVGFREPHEIVFSQNSCINTILLTFAQFVSRWMRKRRLWFPRSFLAQQSSTRPRQEFIVQSETKEVHAIY